MGKRIVISMIFCILTCLTEAQGQQARIVFYNVENLFDTKDDPLTNDAEFLPEGDKNWTYERFYRKIVRIYQVMVAVGEGELPAVIGLCEIENREVLERLIYDTPLRMANYKIIHRESQDSRGVDVALLYRPDVFYPDTATWLKVPLGPGETTREILHVTGFLWEDDTVHFFVNHWPSRYGGAGSSGIKRLAAASTLAASVKGLLSQNINARIIIMGDFNDEPGDESIRAINKILENNSDPGKFSVVNLSEISAPGKIGGTIKHKGTWCVFDQFMVSRTLLDKSEVIQLAGDKTLIFRPFFLLEKDETYSGYKLFRTYLGPGYHNGFSDHLPVSIIIGKTVIEN